MRRSLVVLGVTAIVVILGFVALFAAGGGGSASDTGTIPTLPTTVTVSEGVTTTTIVTLEGPRGIREPVVFVAAPNVMGETLAYAEATLSKLGLSPGTNTTTAKPRGTTETGTVLAQSPGAGSKVEPGQVIQLTVSGY